MWPGRAENHWISITQIEITNVHVFKAFASPRQQKVNSNYKTVGGKTTNSPTDDPSECTVHFKF